MEDALMLSQNYSKSQIFGKQIIRPPTFYSATCGCSYRLKTLKTLIFPAKTGLEEHHAADKNMWLKKYNLAGTQNLILII